MRSGHPGRPRASAAFAAAVDHLGRAPRGRGQAAGGAARRADPAGPRGRAGRDPERPAARSGPRLPGNAHFSLPRLRGRRPADAAGRRGIECSTGSACSAGVAQPSHVLLAMGADEDRARGSLRFSLGHTSTQEDVDALGGGRSARPSSAPVAPASPLRAHTRSKTMSSLRVLAAMSGGVDSAVAAARAVDAGHDVTGVHLALSPTPARTATGARGCCTLEDSRDARRAADVIGIPFYVWDMAERFHADVVEDFVGRVRRRAARPTRACAATRRSSSPRSWTGPGPRLRRRRAPATTPGIDDAARCAAAVDTAKDQSYVLAVLTREQLAARDVPARRHHQGPGARGGAPSAAWPWPTSRTRHDICFIADGDTRGFLAEQLGAAPGPIVDTDGRRGRQHEGTYGFTVGQRRGLQLDDPADDGRPRYVLRHRTREPHRHRRHGRRPRDPRHHRPAPRSGPAVTPSPTPATAGSSCAPTARCIPA